MGDVDEVEVEEPVEPEVEAEEQAEPEEAPTAEPEHTSAAAPEESVAEELRTALGSMREESDRIAGLETGQEQVEAAERFAEDAGRLDESIGSAARAADDDRG
ncbi:MAG: hypothetical protein JWM98_3268 [Thermoleophilia bacterium]|nr:hypothetical protein [Thermoleophilia bacterium]